MSEAERSSEPNGIWMCDDHGRVIDSKDPMFTTELLREWRRQAHADSWMRVMRNEPMAGPAKATDADVAAAIRVAAEADLDVFRHTTKWPSTSVSLVLKVAGITEPVTSDGLARAVSTLDDLILVAPPGMGKTTTIFQIAEGILQDRDGVPILLPLGDWATEESPILPSILKRPAFRDISEERFRERAARPGVVLLLDGWNELDAVSRKRARVQVERLKAELPELGLIVSTRKQVLDIPFSGTRVNLLPLDEQQQLSIATALRGDHGVALIDRGSRTKGVRDLLSCPLYLTALLGLPKGSPFPATKEEVLRLFVRAQEIDANHAESLRFTLGGLQQEYLEGLAVSATAR